MRTTPKLPFFVPPKERTTAAAPQVADPDDSLSGKEQEWEVRSCGMLVQKRIPAAGGSTGAPPPLPIRVRVKYGAASHEVYLSRHSTFGQLKKLLSERTGVHPLDQKLLFKAKERDSAAFLDVAGVKDRSKIVLMEDTAAKARRIMELRRTATMEKAATAVSRITLAVDKLASKVSQLQSIASKGKKVAEDDVNILIEQLMDQLLKLDGVVADGEVKLQRRNQVLRVQKLVESLDILKVKNSTEVQTPSAAPPPTPPQPQPQPQRQEVNWGTFDLLSGPPATTIATATATSTATAVKLEWELF